MKRKPSTPSKSSWRDIQQANRRGKTSLAARKRRLVLLFRGALGLLLVTAIGVGILGLVYFFDKTSSKPTPLLELRNELVFKSNGVLSESWFQKRFADVLRSDVRQLDVGALKAEIEAYGQVASAAVTVILPSTLNVLLTEREPIMRIRLRGDDGQPQVLLVARDGTLYAGADYPADTLRLLPGVAGLRVRKSASGYEPVGNIDAVAHLLEYTKETLPSVYRHWKVVDLSDWDPEQDYRPSLVRIRSAHIEEIVFSTDAIEEQVTRLAGILEHTQRYQMGQPKFIDLSYGQEAVIRYN
jgi:cell division septal protein FtsQ